MNITRELLNLYVEKGFLTSELSNQVFNDCKTAHVTLREYLLAKEYITEAAELEVLSEFYNIPSVELELLNVDDELIDLFSFEFMKKHKIIPVRRDEDGTLILATARPLDCHTISAISSRFCCKFDLVLVLPSQIDHFIDGKATKASTFKAINDINTENDEKKQSAAQKGGSGPAISKEDDVINNPAVRLVDSIIKEAIPDHASDIHIEPFEKVVNVRYRIDGDLEKRASFPIEAFSAVCARLKIMSGMNIAERRIPQDGRINLKIGDNEYDFRVSTLPTVFGEKFVIRILDKRSFKFTRKDIGFTEDENLVVDKMLARPHGIILLTGPTGCGKSTTLYSFIKEVNDPTVNIVTVEDPVEYSMEGVNQTQVNTKANMTFAAALRSILRQDPDIIMIGEIRDEETAEIAVRSAITGHLVFSTLHTNDAVGAITRLEDMGVDNYLVADALVGVIAQRLVKRLCPMCKSTGLTNEKEMEILGINEPIEISRPCGCNFCGSTGYRGRIAVHEIMYMNENMKNAVLTEKNLEVLRKHATDNGMVSLWNSCVRLVKDGTTSIQELLTLKSE